MGTAVEETEDVSADRIDGAVAHADIGADAEYDGNATEEEVGR